MSKYDSVYDLINSEKKMSFTTFETHDKKNPLISLYKYRDVILSGSQLKINNNFKPIKGLSYRTDHFIRNLTRTPFSHGSSNKTIEIKNGFICRTNRDSNYQMFLVECVPLLWYLFKLAKQNNCPKMFNIIIIGNDVGFKCQVHQFVKEIISNICNQLIIKIKMIEQNCKIKCENLYIGEPVLINFIDLFPKITPSISTIYESITKKKEKKITNFGKLIYITRKDARHCDNNAIGSGNRKIQNHNFNELLENLNFNCIEASKYNTSEKIDLFSKCKVCIIESGASSTNAIFLPPNATIILIESFRCKWYGTWMIDWLKKWIDNCLDFLKLNVILYKKTTATADNTPYKIIDINDFFNLVNEYL
tara:strand:- start:174 stop:1262 length:1089 start_codon:yes stop_codon:yes gene_type:complete